MLLLVSGPETRLWVWGLKPGFGCGACSASALTLATVSCFAPSVGLFSMEEEELNQSCNCCNRCGAVGC